MRAKFIRGEDPKKSMGIGKYHGLPQEVINAVELLRDLGYLREEYESSFHLQKEGDKGMNQFFYNHDDQDYTWQGAKLLWDVLFWIPIKTPKEFYDYYGNSDDYYIPDELSFEVSLTFGKIDPNSQAAKYHGGPIIAELNIKADGSFLDLPKSYERYGIKNSVELNEFISKKLKDLEIYTKRFLKKKHLNESIDFERGKDPKSAMSIGRANLNYFQNHIGPFHTPLEQLLEEMVFISRSEDQQILEKAANLLGVTKSEVRIACNKYDEPISASDIQEHSEDHEWTYYNDAETERNYLIQASTLEIYVVDREYNDLFLMLLGAIY